MEDEFVTQRVEELMDRLDSLIDGEAAAAHLVACGQAAIEPLRRFVLDSPARGVPQPRCWAVQALAGLGAKDVLLEYLRREDCTADPVVRLAEEAVQRAAARALAAWRTDEVFDCLLTLTLRHPIAGVVEALGEFERPEAVPVLMETLEDDFCRPWAEAALARVADRNRDLLIRSARIARPTAEEEREPSLRRRRAILMLLRDVRLSEEECRRVVDLADSPDVEVAANAAALAIRYGDAAVAERARRRLRTIAPTAPWHLYSDVQSLLAIPTGGHEARRP